MSYEVMLNLDIFSVRVQIVTGRLGSAYWFQIDTKYKQDDRGKLSDLNIIRNKQFRGAFNKQTEKLKSRKKKTRGQ